VLKRVFDVLAGGFLMLMLLPIFLLLAALVAKDGGSPFYGHTRIGQNGRRFKCYKFRSMVRDADKVLKDLLDRDPVARAEWEKDFKLKNDVRVTPVGALLRKTSLDELPQLWNVLRGDMSLVGPRPVVEKEIARYGDEAAYYLLAKPGMTGLWQVSGRNDTDYARRVFLDAWYVRNWSLWYDIAILFKTVGVVLRRDGAY
jgi:Undecaprenyl-phosphate galactose phosphotransferase WbaP